MGYISKVRISHATGCWMFGYQFLSTESNKKDEITATNIDRMMVYTNRTDYPLQPGSSSSTIITIHTPIPPLCARSGVQCTHRFRPCVSYLDTHLMRAVTLRPSMNERSRSSRTVAEPPTLEKKGDCRIPGMRREGDVKRIRREG